MTPIPPQSFVDVLLPLVKGRDAEAAVEVLRARGWRVREVAGLLRHSEAGVRVVSAGVLGLVGESSSAGPLAGALRDDCEAVAEAAADALWSVWMRAGDAGSVGAMRRGVALIASEHYAAAVEPLEQAVELDPNFAEAHHQLGLAWAMLDRWGRAMPCFLRAAGLCRSHFGAIAAVGHSHAQAGRLGNALRWYRKALAINPRLVEVAHAVRAIEAAPAGRVEEPVPSVSFARPV